LPVGSGFLPYRLLALYIKVEMRLPFLKEEAAAFEKID
jgi:hypothetical protein